MTTIAFDGKILAADRGIGHMGNCVVSGVTPKIVFGFSRMAAYCGNSSDGRVLADWWVKGGVGDPPKDIENDVCLVGIDRNCRDPLYISNVGRPLEMPAPYAEASGSQVAMGAMMAGANAVEAVRIACQLDKNTLGPIDYVIVGAEEWIIRQAPDPATRDTVEVRHDGDVPTGVRLGNGSANGGSAPHPQHEGHP